MPRRPFSAAFIAKFSDPFFVLLLFPRGNVPSYSIPLSPSFWVRLIEPICVYVPLCLRFSFFPTSSSSFFCRDYSSFSPFENVRSGFSLHLLDFVSSLASPAVLLREKERKGKYVLFSGENSYTRISPISDYYASLLFLSFSSDCIGLWQFVLISF